MASATQHMRLPMTCVTPNATGPQCNRAMQPRNATAQCNRAMQPRDKRRNSFTQPPSDFPRMGRADLPVSQQWHRRLACEFRFSARSSRHGTRGRDARATAFRPATTNLRRPIPGFRRDFPKLRRSAPKLRRRVPEFRRPAPNLRRATINLRRPTPETNRETPEHPPLPPNLHCGLFVNSL